MAPPGDSLRRSGVPGAVEFREIAVEDNSLGRKRGAAQRPVRSGRGEIGTISRGSADPIVETRRRREVRDRHGHSRRGRGVVAGGDGDGHRRVGIRRDVNERMDRNGRRCLPGRDRDGTRVVHVVHACDGGAVRERVVHDERERVVVDSAHGERRRRETDFRTIGDLRERERSAVDRAEGELRCFAAGVLGHEENLVGRVVRRSGERTRDRVAVGIRVDAVRRRDSAVEKNVRHVRRAVRERGGNRVGSVRERKRAVRELRLGGRDQEDVRQLRSDNELVRAEASAIRSVGAGHGNAGRI